MEVELQQQQQPSITYSTVTNQAWENITFAASLSKGFSFHVFIISSFPSGVSRNASQALGCERNT